MDGLRIAEKSIELLCAPGLHSPTTAYGRALNQAVWQERDEGVWPSAWSRSRRSFSPWHAIV